MIVLWDADSSIFKSCVCSKEESDDGFIHDVDDAILKFENEYQGIVNVLAEVYDMHDVSTLCFVQGRTNFRKIIYPKYKKQRASKPKPPLLDDIKAYAIEEHKAHVSHGVETDDSIVSYWRKYTDIYGTDSCIIAANDKDYKQIPCLYFDLYWKRFGELSQISEQEALLNYYTQFITGDRADEYNLIKGKGLRYVQKHISTDDSGNDMRDFVLKVYQETYPEDWRKMFFIAELLVTLRQDISYLPDIEF